MPAEDVARTVLLSAEQDQFVAQVMETRGWSRSQVVRAAIDKLRADPIIFLGTFNTIGNQI